MNMNNLTPCLPATVEDGSVPVKPVCKYTYIGSVLHFFVEAAGATRQNATVKVNREPTEFIIEAVVQREHRADRCYYARIRLLHTNFCKYSYENMGWDVSNGEIDIGFLSNSLRLILKFLYVVSFNFLKSEYQGGVSAWNFDIEDLKAQESLKQHSF